MFLILLNIVHLNSLRLITAKIIYGYLILHHHISTETNYQLNQRSSMIDLIFTSDDQSITNLIYASPLGKNHHKVLKFSYLIKCSLNQEFQRISYYQ